MPLYSKRNRKPPNTLSYKLSQEVRVRLLKALQRQQPNESTWQVLLARVHDEAVEEYGTLSTGPDSLRGTIPIIRHYISCRDDLVLDFLELCFRAGGEGMNQPAVERLNAIFQDSYIGYELTSHRFDELPLMEKLDLVHQREDFLPRVIRIDDRAAHELVVSPAQVLLQHKRFTSVNTQFLEALSEHRAGNDEDALTDCGSTFESFLRVVCDEKKWKYEDKATLAPLVEVCFANGLFPGYYSELFKLVGTIRNRLSDAHGRGQNPPEVTPAHAAHMIHLICAHMLFLNELAQLK